MVIDALAVEEVRRKVEALPDPELPILTLGQLGVIRDVRIGADGTLTIDLTPTFSGCPALEVMQRDIESAASRAGHDAVVNVVLSPAWSTDWITDDGRKALLDNGIAPPQERRDGPVALTLGRHPASTPTCPQCGSGTVEELARFGGTPCMSMWRCLSCREPFDGVKPL